jgi:glucose/arabinose dehydrogenase
MRARIGGCCLVAAFALLAGGGAEAGQSAGRLGLALIATGFADPVYVTAPRTEPNRLYVVQRNGRVHVVDRTGAQIHVFLDLGHRVGRRGFQGLHSIAFHPRYSSNGRLYVSFATPGNDILVEEYRARGSSVDPRSRRLILRIPQAKSGRYAHFGGQLAFGPDGRLYAAIGDGLEDGAQNPRNLYGKLLRLDVDGVPRRPAVIGYGLRNPWRFSFDRGSGSLYIADVGEAKWEEINLVRPGAKPLLNFGWDAVEGRERREPDTPLAGRVVFPVAVYGHAAGNCSITGGFVYRGTAVPSARGRYFFADFCSGRIWTLKAGGGQETMRPTGLRVKLLSSFGEDARGELYVIARTGRVYRLVER